MNTADREGIASVSVEKQQDFFEYMLKSRTGSKDFFTIRAYWNYYFLKSHDFSKGKLHFYQFLCISVEPLLSFLKEKKEENELLQFGFI